MMAETESPNKAPIVLEELDTDRQQSWSVFTRFIVITTVGLVITLLLIAAFTVWS